ncbi:hypothetical protein CLOM_g5116, partial [Closterium sp. NIES-68]
LRNRTLERRSTSRVPRQARRIQRQVSIALFLRARADPPSPGFSAALALAAMDADVAAGAADSPAAMAEWRGEVARVARQLSDRAALERANGLTALDALLAGVALGSEGAGGRMEAVSACLLAMQGGDPGAGGAVGEGERAEGEAGGAGKEGREAEMSTEGGGGASGSNSSSGGSGGGWTARHGGFLGAEVLLRHWSRVLGAPREQQHEARSVKKGEGSSGGQAGGRGAGVVAFCSGAGEAALRRMDDEEPRVRLAAAEALCALAHYGSLHDALTLFRAVKAHIMHTLQQQQPLPPLLEGQEEGEAEGGRDGEGEKGGKQAVLGAQEGEGEQEGADGGVVCGEDAPSSPRADQAGLAAAMGQLGGVEGVGGAGGGGCGGRASRAHHGATGIGMAARGRSLETALRSLQRLLDGVGERPGARAGCAGGEGNDAREGGAGGEGGKEEGEAEWCAVVGEMSRGTVDATGAVVRHGNRFVREAAMFALAALCRVMGEGQLASLGESIALQLAVGLGDNWSQVRYAASVANRGLFLSAGAVHHKDRYLPTLLPAMVFNRYYGADGVRIYSQDTWQQVMGGGGRAAVARHMQQVVPFYRQQARAQNYLVRETACFCIAEVASKIDRQVVLPVLPDLLPCLLQCHSDPVWPVRCAACSASATVVEQYGDMAAQHIATWAPTWLANLTDVIPAVRQHAAALIGAALNTRETQGRAVQITQDALHRLLPAALSSHSPHSSHSHAHTHPPSPPSTAAAPSSCCPAHPHSSPSSSTHHAHPPHTHPPHTHPPHTHPPHTHPPHALPPHAHPPAAAPPPGLQAVRIALRDPDAPPDPAHPASRFTFEPLRIGASAPHTHAPAPAAAAAAAASAAPDAAAISPPLSIPSQPPATAPSLSASPPSLPSTASPPSAPTAPSTPSCSCHQHHPHQHHPHQHHPHQHHPHQHHPHQHAATAEAWEQSEGAVLLLPFLAAAAPAAAGPFIPTLAQLASSPEAAAHAALQASIMRRLPAIAKAVGKRQFKPSLELFLDPLFAALTSTQPEVAAAAGAAVAELQLLIGPTIFEGRLSSLQREAMTRYKHLIHLRPQQPSEPGMPPHAHHRPGS